MEIHNAEFLRIKPAECPQGTTENKVATRLGVAVPRALVRLRGILPMIVLFLSRNYKSRSDDRKQPGISIPGIERQ
jgi:hypothetical protein